MWPVPIWHNVPVYATYQSDTMFLCIPADSHSWSCWLHLYMMHHSHMVLMHIHWPEVDWIVFLNTGLNNIINASQSLISWQTIIDRFPIIDCWLRVAWFQFIKNIDFFQHWTLNCNIWTECLNNKPQSHVSSLQTILIQLVPSDKWPTYIITR